MKSFRIRNLNYKHLLTDSFIIIASLYLSLYLRTAGTASFEAQRHELARLIPIFLAIRLLTLVFTGAYDIIWRYVSLQDALSLFKGVALSTSFIIAATYLIDLGRVPRSVFFIDGILCGLLLAAVRIGRRQLYERAQIRTQAKGDRRRVLIYGAGDNGRLLAARLQTDQIVGYDVVGFVDDNTQKVGREIRGLQVLGTFGDLDRLIPSHRVQEVIVAITQTSPALLKKVFEGTRKHGIRPRLITGLLNRSDKAPAFELTRDIDLNDLLNRPSRTLHTAELKKLVATKSVLITGAGGSIGSELARQVARLGPSRLVLLDQSEYNLYEIDQELRYSEDEKALVVPVLGDLKDRAGLSRIFSQYLPEIVLHAAAYKHVHLVEANPYAAILNNIEGTKNLVELSQEFDVRHFVQISTDKAVNPVGIMGTTKRVCELLVTQVGKDSGRHYCSVRFGNVLGSSGSLIPLLKKQILNGEPVTITHPDMTRYFMLIPEAVSLVLKAAAVTQSGDIAILKMGAPVKILDIAKHLITLMGKKEGEVPILFTGIRPGEKLFEELCLTGKEKETEHPDIMILPGGDSEGWQDGQSLYRKIHSVIAHAKEQNPRATAELRALLQPDAAIVPALTPTTPPAEFRLH